MAALSASILLAVWTASEGGAAHRRLSTLIAAAGGGEGADRETLGGRNRRLLALHDALVGEPIEAHVECPACGTDCEFEVPAAAILATPSPKPDLRIAVGRRTFRPPLMADIEAVAGSADLRAQIAERCLVEGRRPVPAAAAALERRLEALDPAADVTVEALCAECGGAISASVDIATFVARALDRLVEGLLGDIDMIASAYGWSEADILALPPPRRRRYVAMIAARRSPPRPRLAGTRP